MVEGRQDGERVETDAAQEVDHGQVDAQQLRAHHLLPPAVADHQNQPIAQNGEQNWTRRQQSLILFTFKAVFIIILISAHEGSC